MNPIAYLIFPLPFVFAYLAFRWVKGYDVKENQRRLDELKKQEEDALAERLATIQHIKEYPVDDDALYFFRKRNFSMFTEVSKILGWVDDDNRYIGRSRRRKYSREFLVESVGQERMNAINGLVESYIKQLWLMHEFDYSDGYDMEKMADDILSECIKIIMDVEKYQTMKRIKANFKSSTSFRRSCIGQPAKCDNVCGC